MSSRPTWTSGSLEMNAFIKLLDIIYQRHPDLANWSDWSAVGDTSVLIDNGGPPSPFAQFDYQGYSPESYHDSGIFEGRQCDLFLLFFENTPVNHDGDGILVGEGYIFYMVGETGPYKLDGELKEIHFVFPPPPSG